MKSEVSIVLRKDLDFTKVRYYTLKFGDEKSELDKFYDNYQENYSRSIFYIKMWIAEIGEKLGAQSRFFRPEDNVSALPPPANELQCIDIDLDNQNMNLRLYCIVLSSEIVILVNGGIKESQATQNSPSCWKQYMFASNIASQIKNMTKAGHFSIQGKVIKEEKLFKLTYKR